MNKVFKELSSYVRLHDGIGKPKINFQNLYELFPKFEFIPTANFGQYENFGNAFENKNLSMHVYYEGKSCLMVYKEYGDANENTAYVC